MATLAPHARFFRYQPQAKRQSLVALAIVVIACSVAWIVIGRGYLLPVAPLLVLVILFIMPGILMPGLLVGHWYFAALLAGSAGAFIALFFVPLPSLARLTGFVLLFGVWTACGVYGTMLLTNSL